MTLQKGEVSASNVMILGEGINLKARLLRDPSRLEAGPSGQDTVSVGPPFLPPVSRFE